MKKRIQFVSNSSSSSFVGILKNDTNKPIELRKWFMANAENLADKFYTDGGYTDIPHAIKHAIITRDYMVEGLCLELQPGEKIYVNICIDQSQLEQFEIVPLIEDKIIGMSTIENIKDNTNETETSVCK